MKKIILFLFVFIYTISHSQIQIKSKLLNKANNNPIEYASVLIQETFEGTISDSLGVFEIKVLDETQHLIIQCLGFKTDTFLVSDVLKTNFISLKVEDIALSEVTITPKNSFEIMRKAVKNIPKNYYAKTMSQNVFYRQEIVANNKILSLEEANFNALTKYKNNNANITSINKARAIIDLDTLKSLGKLIEKSIEDFDTIDIKQNSSQLFDMNFMLQDEIATDKKSLFGEKGFKNYKYSYNGLVKKDTFYAYHITFDQLDNVKKSLFKGHFYIDTATFAFIDIHIYLSPKGISYQKVIPKSMQFIMKVLGYTVYIKGLNYNVHYTKYNNNWVLDYADSKLSAKVSKKNGGSFDGYQKTIFKVNKLYPKEFFYNKKSKYDKINSNISDFKNPIFWNNYRYIKLSKKEKELINKN